MFKTWVECNFKFDFFYPKLSNYFYLVFSFFISNYFTNNAYFENKNKHLK